MSGAHAKRLGLLALMALAALNLFTGAPLVAIWVGSQVQGEGFKAGASRFVVMVEAVVQDLAEQPLPSALITEALSGK